MSQTEEQRRRWRTLAYKWRNKPENKERISRTRRANYAKNKDKLRSIGRLRRYGLTANDLLRMRAQQNGLCAICGCEMTIGKGESTSEAVDHSHETGTVRGLLCFLCNASIGAVDRHGLTWLAKALSYLNPLDSRHGME